MNRTFKRIFIFILLIAISFAFSDSARKVVVGFSTSVVKFYDDKKNGIYDFFKEHFNQRDEIRFLREENKRLTEISYASVGFSEKLNSFLKEANVRAYEPQTKLVRVLSYSNLGDYNKFWIDFDDFNANKVYGLLYQGYSAGIVVENLGRPQAILQNDAKSTFSVYIGESKIRGITFGAKDHIEVKYIPLWTKPQIDEEVVTSGLDEIFFEGIKVGKVVEVVEDEGFFTAVVKPYIVPQIPGFFHVIIK
ncbi:MAG: rod shape-determining protein MreC [Campylobacteraceae bacterium]|jgi:rod shape-determining protein MreC|nr:rod shape-determining protein MreC [Campylobacteraceae bacterium]